MHGLEIPSPSSDVDAGPRWRRRPALRVAVRLLVVLAPAVAATAVAIAVSRTWPVPAGPAGTLAWWGLLILATIATWMLCASLLERMLPLASLLDLTLTFPYSAPSRLAMLRRNPDPRRLEGELRRLRQKADPQTAVRAQLILEFAVALSIHDSRTGGHSERVRMFTDMVARELHLSRRDADRLRWAALLHDIGKLAVAPEVLNKAQFPDEDELEALRIHPIEGYRLIAPLHEWLGPWAATVRDHHEHFDGTGYPNGLRGTEISLGGRIVAVTDSYEAMTAGRPYRTPLSVRAAREELVRRSGTHFDPAVVRAFLTISAVRLWPVVGVSALLAGVPFLARTASGLSHLSLRFVSAALTASATATLLVAGVLAPAVSGQLPGLTPTGPAVARTVPASTPQPAPSAAVPPATQSTPPAAPPIAATTGPGSGSQAGGPPPAPGLRYPAGIARHATLPPGIAKQPNAFTHWRAHH